MGIMPRIGDRVDDYELVEELGSGAAATVFRARSIENADKFYAIKILGMKADGDEELQRRFVREIAVMQKVQHPHIVRIEKGGLHGSSLYYVMELVDSGTLKEVTGRALPWGDVTECAIQLCKTLHVMHEHGVVHRDLKPANIYLASDGNLKIGDFGLARDLNAERLTMDGMTVGSVLYMSPEQIRGNSEITGAADMYSLGCVLFEMLSGSPPFNGPDAMCVLELHLDADRPSVDLRSPNIPADLSELVMRLMSIDAYQRPTASKTAVLLELIHAGKPINMDEVSVNVGSAKAGTTERSSPSEQEVVDNVEQTSNLTSRLRESETQKHSDVSWTVLTLVGIAILVLLVVVNFVQ